jgi:hypothetical protein
MRGQQGLAQTVAAIVQQGLVTSCDDMGMETNEGWRKKWCRQKPPGILLILKV